MATKVVLKTNGLTERRSAILGMIVKEYETFDNHCALYETNTKEFQLHINSIQTRCDGLVNSVAEKDEQIEKLKVELDKLNQTVVANENEIHALKTAAQNHAEEINRAIVAERDLHKQKEAQLKAKYSKLRADHKKVIDELQLKLTTVQQNMIRDNSDDEEDMNTVNEADAQQDNSDSDGNGDEIDTLSSADERFSASSERELQGSSGGSSGSSSGCHSGTQDETQAESENVKSKIYICDEAGCNKGFMHKSSRAKHLLTHGKIKRFNCTFSGCTRSFVQKCDLERHIRTHTGEKPFPCKTCGKKFNQMGNLRIHMQTHKKVKIL